ncbi:MAG TPA: mannose-1-phosphate guanylyltransferase/mannose-6-phosphate isomerase [Methylibium sp.]|uniref:mannose-1-phosphate guanylyltransferase/mannose-6-phosphate isomerase n=1 Tax=Methylibium sp. TaxID=2067992 RepID=UPI002DB7C623|nr:mannose-1-phosphate guanylyltransferase/mannose-6-phosphate isomerase [Methylibium sp.]HEU4460720.1 mannose-1-phosphate guanylyltransferase/mannose-6-phosphate isomerase [Methylibium sp.]
MNTPLSVQPVVMAGGSGTRLWPLSRAGFPKQFLALTGKHTLFQQAVQRLAAVAAPEFSVGAPLVIGNEDHRFLVMEQLREVKLDAGASLVLEPSGRNTAPALTLAALQATDDGADPVLVVTPSDQTVADGAAFTAALRQAVRVAADGAICILGIKPVRPETGYGYIHANAASHAEVSNVRAFVEKPDAATAQRYITDTSDGHYFWNSGMFVLRASVWLAALERYRPDILAATRAAWAGRKNDAAFVRPDAAAFAAVPSESVDYAVMEPCSRGSASDATKVRMVALDAGWNDLGAWDAVWQATPKDGNGNAVVGDVLLHDARNVHVHATSRLVGVAGVEDVVVVETADAVLVTHRNRSQDVKQIVAALGHTGRGEQNLHRKVHRPWGWYDSVDAGARFQVKRIMVKPGASLSLQMHHHRAEHWIVVSGTAEVTCGEKKILLSENQSTYIPLGETHRLANPGKTPLEIIEVQSGSYLGEDDIVRFEDTYGRH